MSLLHRTGSDGEDCTDSGGLFQINAAAAGKARSPMVAREVRGATSADELEERSRRRELRSEILRALHMSTRGLPKDWRRNKGDTVNVVSDTGLH